MDKKEKRKYLLFTKDDDRPASQKPCAFFATPEGCRNGKSCVFLHGAPVVIVAPQDKPKVSRPVVADDSSVSSSSSSSSSSSESVKVSNKKTKVDNSNNNSGKNGSSKAYNPTVIDDKKLAALDEITNELKRKLDAEREEERKMYEKQIKLQKEQLEEYQNKLKMTVTAAAAAVPPAVSEVRKSTRIKENKTIVAPKSVAQSTPAVTTKKVPTTEEEDTRFLFGAVDVALGNATPSALTTRMEASNTPVIPTVTAYSNDSPFVPSGDFMKILSTSGTEHATKGPTREKDNKKQKKAESSTTTVAAAAAITTVTGATSQTRPQFSSLDGDLSDLNWKKCVEISHKHPKYDKDYKFDVDKSWISTDSAPASKVPKKVCYKVLAIDCEMCQTTDPLTNEHESNALIRFSIVNGLNPSEVVIDQLVSPAMPITEIRTNIHGIKESDVADVKYTLRHAQAFLLSICDSNTILVGHGLCHDLKALHFDHKNIIDTAYLYKISNESSSLPSVRDVSEQVLGVKLLDIHDSVQDARASLYAAIFALQHETLPTITRSVKNSSSNSDSSLLMHRIPESCTIEHIREMLLATTHILPVSFTPVEFNNSTGKTTITFQSARHMELVFDSVPGPNRPDKSSKAQKRIYLKNGGYMCLRKL